MNQTGPTETNLNISDDEALLGTLDRVIAEPLKFKSKLHIGENAYALFRASKGVRELFDVAGFASTGAAMAGSSVVANTFFSGGFLAALGIGTATTPVGWVVAAAVVSGGAYMGVTRILGRYHGRHVQSIPRFINTPLDTLGVQLLDMIGGLALRISSIDGMVADEERDTICRHFVDEWGYDTDYVNAAVHILEANIGDARVKDIARSLARFQAANPDCNAPAMQEELMSLLREVVAADGIVDEREELALDAIEEVFRQERAISLENIGRGMAVATETAAAATATMTDFAKRIVGKAKGE